MQEWFSEIASFILGVVGGGAIGSLVTFKIVKNSSTNNSRIVTQSNIRAGRDNIGGDRA